MNATAKPIAEGTIVLHEYGEFVYGGPNEGGEGWTSISYSLRYPGSRQVITCDGSQVAPVAELADVDPKDARISIVKAPEEQKALGRHLAGPWRACLMGTARLHTTWHKTRKDAREVLTARLQIAIYHDDVTPF